MKKLIFLIFLLPAILFCQKTEAQVNPSQEEMARKDSVKVQLQKAQGFLKQGNPEEASKIYLSIMESEPDNKEAVQGWLMANMKRSPTGEEDAIKQLDELNKKYPENTAVIFFRAFIEVEYGHNEEALKDIEGLIKVKPDDALNYILKGQVLHSMEQYNEAILAFDRATSLDPSRWDVWSMKAGSLAKINKFDEAIISINKGMELAPNEPANIYNRACIYCLKGDKANALADLQKAISMNPFFKGNARKDEDFKSLYEDEDFKKLTQQ
jgi:tetratricopeptide (TPR) repeat protein